MMIHLAAHPDELVFNSCEHDIHALERAMPELWSLLSLQNQQPVTISQISGLHAQASSRGAYRIECEDGSILKVRYLASPYLAERIYRVNQSVPSGLLSPIFSLNGNAVLEGWVEGTTLDSIHLTPDLIRSAGRLLGQIHSSSLFEGCAEYSQNIVTKAQQIEESLAQLKDQGALTAQETSLLLEQARSFLPANADFGIVHGDLTRENIVASGDRLVAIDNGGLSCDLLDGDLARTWYRWPMNQEQQQCFFEGYRQFRDTTSFEQHFAFWAIWVLSRATLFHLREETGRDSMPLRRLKELAGN